MPDPTIYLATDTDLTSVANKIRSKTGSTSGLSFPSGFNTEVDKLTDTRDANATAGQILSGRTAYVNKAKITGTIPTKTASDVTVSSNTVNAPAGYYASAVTKTVGTAKAAETYNPSSSDRSIPAGRYLTGAQTIKGVTATNLSAGNIKSGVTVSVSGLSSVTGTYTSSLSTSPTAQMFGFSPMSAGSQIGFNATITPPSGYTLANSGIARIVIPSGLAIKEISYDKTTGKLSGTVVSSGTSTFLTMTVHLAFYKVTV